MARDDASECLDETVVFDFVTGALDDPGLARVDAHLARCEQCRTLVACAAHGSLSSTSGEPMSIDERFEVGAFIARGGMGAVYHGFDRSTGEPVAIKVLRPEVISEYSDLLGRFIREGEILRRLDHPNIVKLIAAGTTGARQCLVMEYVEGGSLRDLLRTQPQLPIARVLQIGLELADALARAHHLKVLHRDIKPENVLLSLDGTPRLTDFGLARSGEPRLSTVEVVVGTVAYLSPEALLGLPLDERTDIWACGVTLFEMLAGLPPFEGAQLGALTTAILKSPTPDLETLRPDAPIALVDLIYRMLEKDRPARIASARQLGAELEAIQKDLDHDWIPKRQISSRFIRPSNVEAALTAVRASNNLPAPTTSFVGRQAELAELSRLIAEPGVRFVSIVGPGGMGKTRLAIEVARCTTKQAEEPGRDHMASDGTWLVTLAALDAPELVVPAIAEAVGLHFYATLDPKAQLFNYLHDKSMLLVLDNFEHVLSAAGMVSELLEHAGGIKVLATSRERLNLHGETLFRIDGLQWPDSEAAAAGFDYGAAQLFLQSARRVKPDFSLQPHDAGRLLGLCRQVHGMPLGLLLAAAWVDVLSLQEISAEIARNLNFLETEQRDLPARQRSITAAFAYSYNLLSTPEQQAFEQLSVFRGSFTREAAQAVSAADLRTLASLVNKSMLTRQPSGRYDMHQLLRQYALSRLAEAPSRLEDIQLRHCEYFRSWVRGQALRLHGAEQKQACAALEADVDNAYAAWDFSLRAGRFDLSETLLDGLEVCIFYREHIQEYRDVIFKPGIDHVRPHAACSEHVSLLARLLAGYGLMCGFAGDEGLAQAALDEAEALLDESNGDMRAWALVTLQRGKLFAQRQMTLGKPLANLEFRQQRAQHILENLRAEWHTAWNEFVLSRIQLALEKAESALESAENSLSRFGRLGDRLGQRLPNTALGFIALHQNKLDAARRHFETALQIAEEYDSQLPIAFAHYYLSRVALLSGDCAAASLHGERSVAIFEQRQHPEKHAVLTLLAQVAERSRSEDAGVASQ